MLHFECDYLEGAHPLILKRLMETNMEKTPGYTTDEYCEMARQKIRHSCACPDAEIHFLVGGTQTNATVIDAWLRPYEGVIAAESGHINQHEAGAIEAGGHKVIALPHQEGKLAAATLKAYLNRFYADETYPHMVNPGMVYISHPTEYGTLYTRSELEALAEVCHQHQLPLYLDGARLGYGLAARDTDLTLPHIAALCDAFYIGGTKVGALFGEALVFPRPGRIKQMFSIVKQHGALLAKGRLLGLQFDTLFSNNLYFEISRQAINRAEQLREALEALGYIFFVRPQSNQLFVLLNNRQLNALKTYATFSVWDAVGTDHTVIRLATSWATTEEDVNQLIEALRRIRQTD